MAAEADAKYREMHPELCPMKTAMAEFVYITEEHTYHIDIAAKYLAKHIVAHYKQTIKQYGEKIFSQRLIYNKYFMDEPGIPVIFKAYEFYGKNIIKLDTSAVRKLAKYTYIEINQFNTIPKKNMPIIIFNYTEKNGSDIFEILEKVDARRATKYYVLEILVIYECAA